jgi:hypothetical protein
MSENPRQNGVAKRQSYINEYDTRYDMQYHFVRIYIVRSFKNNHARAKLSS